jgi:hypothetical protein
MKTVFTHGKKKDITTNFYCCTLKLIFAYTFANVPTELNNCTRIPEGSKNPLRRGFPIKTQQQNSENTDQ